jgi:V/A-type H+-transporting ATPase subunit K
MTIDIPSAIAVLGAAASIIGAAIGTAMVQSSVGSAGIGLLAEKPEQSGIALMFLVIPETLVIFGFVVAVLILLGAGLI